jgi:hypothetical protein
MRLRMIVTVLGFALAIPASAAASDAAYEPNEGIHQAFGPLQANTDYEGTISSSTDRDWYVFYVSGPGVIDVKLTNTIDSAGCCSGPRVSLLDADGHTLNHTSVGPGDVKDLEYTAPGAGTYYIAVEETNEIPDSYVLRVTGPLTYGPRPGPPDEVTPNNNPDQSSAYGPLAGGRLYGGSIDAYAEEDWFYFYTAGAGSFDIAFTNIADGLGCCGGPNPELYKDDEFLFSGFAGQDEIDHLTYTAPGPAKFYLRVFDASPGDKYQFRIDPASLLTTVPPSTTAPTVTPTPTPAKVRVTAACRQARSTRKGVFAAFKKAQRKRAKAARKARTARTAKARHNWSKSKRRWAKAAKKRRKALTAANRSMKGLCT